MINFSFQNLGENVQNGRPFEKAKVGFRCVRNGLDPLLKYFGYIGFASL